MAEKILKADFEETYRNYCDTVYKIAFIHIKKPDDSNDIVQEVFLKYHLTKKSFADEKEKEAWLIRSAHTATMDYFRTKMRKEIRIKDMEKMHLPFEIDDTLAILLTMPDKFRTPMFLHYSEGYSAEEIAKILHKSVSGIKSNLEHGKQHLDKKLGGEVR